MVSRKVLLWALFIALGAYCWNMISVQEVAVLRVSTARGEHYAQVWVVDDRPYVWIRAETLERMWLQPLRENPTVQLTRGETRTAYQAYVRESVEGRAQVDAWFRAKYGVVDTLRGWLHSEPSILIRLEPI